MSITGGVTLPGPGTSPGDRFLPQGDHKAVRGHFEHCGRILFKQASKHPPSAGWLRNLDTGAVSATAPLAGGWFSGAGGSSSQTHGTGPLLGRSAPVY